METRVAIIFILVGLAFVIFLLAYNTFINKKQLKQQQTLLAANEFELKRSRENERKLREEISTLQVNVRQSFEDPVTGLPGWKLFEDRLIQNIKESERYQFTLGLLFIDIDNFKVINDSLSYKVGDILLKEVAARLETCIRKVDSITRFSKDTFVVLLAQMGKPEMAAIIAQRMLKALSQPFQIAGSELYITACIGIAIYPTDGQDAAGLLRSVDYALHLAKAKGKGVYQFYQEKMHSKSQRELALHMSFNRDSIFQEFQLYYQPIIKVEDESIFCMDALLHWRHPYLGMISPAVLFDLAEKQRKLNVVSEWLLKSACKQFLHWRSLGFSPDYLGIPLSIKQLDSSHFIYRISQILQELNFSPEWLLLEIKETSMPLPFDTLEKAFNMLKYLGIKIAIDDFGADSFALAYLKNIRIDYIKLNQAIIEDISQNPQTVALIKSIIYLAKSLSIQVIIQGIEKDQQVALLQDLGCSLMQGRLLGVPLTEREVADKMDM